jgi:hypothetical protein
MLKFKTDKEIDKLFVIQSSLPWDIEERTRRDVADMITYLPMDMANIIDLGCGSGRISVGLNSYFNDATFNYNPKFWLCDCDDSEMKKYWDLYTDNQPRFYNKRILTERFCRMNELTNFEYVSINEQYEFNKTIPPANVLYSKYSIGWHFPIGTYTDKYPDILKPGAVCFFTVRPETDEIPDAYKVCNLPKYFTVIDRIVDSYHWTGDKEKVECGNGRQTLILRYL